jgi:hypothetical protein
VHFNRIPFLSVVAAGFFTGGCQTTPAGCDPSTADFFNNTACLAGGSYRARELRLQRELATEQRLNREFHAVYAALQEEEAATRSRRALVDARYAEVDRAWRDLQEELRRNHGGNQALALRIDQLDRELAERKRPATQTDLRAKERQRADLQRKLELLRRELETGIYD